MKDHEALVKSIKRSTDNLRSMMEASLPSLANEVDSIIKEKDKSIQRIEHILDDLLNYMQLGVGEREFIRLNKYYASFNRENAGSYNQFYSEMKEG